MDGNETGGCPRCLELEEKIRSLEALVARLLARVAELESELAKARKDSSTSSKPPSSDIVKPPRSGRRRKRKRGGQPGHPKHDRPSFAPDQIDETHEHHLKECPDCGGPVKATKHTPRIVQQVEIVERPVTVTEHRGLAYTCRRCRKTHYAPIPQPVVRAGLVGPGLTAVIALLKSACHCSFTTIRKFVRDVLGATISRGQLAKVIAKVSASLQKPYEDLLDQLPTQKQLNVDETGHKDNGERMWTWCFRASLFTLFKIAPSRGSEVLLDVLGREFDGVLGCDYFSAYRKYMRQCGVLVQFCLAHLIRDIKFLTTHPDSRNQAYGRRLLHAAKNLFALIHRRDKLTPQAFASQLEDAGNELWGTAIYRVPPTSEARNLADRFEKHGDSYIRFITTPGLEPTNNLAEQAIRFVVIDRHVTQGSRGPTGQQWLERIWTTIATCTQQGRSSFQFLKDAVAAYLYHQPAPSLIPNTS
jgi:transposase